MTNVRVELKPGADVRASPPLPTALDDRRTDRKFHPARRERPSAGAHLFRGSTTAAVIDEAAIGVEPRGVKRIAGEDLLLGHIIIRNFRRVPAKNVSMFAVTDYYSDSTKMVFKVGDLYKSKTTLQPRAKMVYGAASVVDIDSIEVNKDPGAAHAESSKAERPKPCARLHFFYIDEEIGVQSWN